MSAGSDADGAPPRDAAGAAPGSAPPTRTVLGIVFTTILIDFSGFSILIPVLPLYARSLGASPFEYGLMVALYAMTQLLFLPAWGWVSDRVGRRPVILVSLLGTAGSFALLAVSDSLPEIYVARALGGFFAASVGTAQAVITDATSSAERARGMGLIGAAFGLGFVVGNALGGELAAWHPRLPFVTVVLLSLLNFAVAWRHLPESHAPGATARGWRDLRRTLVPAPVRLLRAQHSPRVGLYLGLFFLLFTAFAAFEAMLALFLREEFGLGARSAGWLFAYIGLFIALTQGVLLGRLVHRFGESRLVRVGLAIMGAGFACVAFAPSYPWFYLVGPMIALGNGIAFPCFTSLFSKACHRDRAGELLGDSQSMATTGRVVGPVWAGMALGGIAPGAPFLIGSAITLFVLLVFHARRTLLVEDTEILDESATREPARRFG